jgi:hypothetical protein
MQKFWQAIFLTVLSGSPVWMSGVCAQQLEPRAYSNVPVGINFMILGYGYASGAVLPDPSLPAEDVSARIHTTVAAYSRSLDLSGKSGQVSIFLPYARASVDGKLEGVPQAVTREGLADPGVKLSVNLLGAPALSLDEFASYRQDTIVGASILLTAPFGQYDPTRLVNIGTNRWSIKPELGVSQAFDRWVFEAALGATFFTDNDEYLGNQSRQQDPIYALQMHAVYNLRLGMWAALDATYYSGGRTSVNGQLRDDLQSNWRWGTTLAFPVNRYNSLKLYANTGVYTRTGTDFDIVGVAWQTRWGAGL